MFKMFFQKCIKAVFRMIMHFPRKHYYKKKRAKLSNTDFTIIASDCFGSFVYHNLNQRFNTPTINLFFSTDDFVLFVAHLKEYLSAELTEVKDHNEKFPIGELLHNGRAIRINFMHYHSFEEAKTKWDERKKRINYSNIYIVQLVASGLTQEHVDKFSALPYEHKLLITHKNEFNADFIFSHDIFSKSNYQSGDFLKHKSLISLERYMDDVDYVEWLNNK